MTPDDLNDLYRTYQHSAFRLECRDTYAIPGEDPDFDDFLAGRSFAARTPETDDWLANVAQQVANGKYFGRVRMLGYPLTPYSRFEMLCYPRENIPTGEEVRILDRRSLPAGTDAWTHQDFWLFDDRIAVLQHYDDEGHFEGVTQAPDAAPYIAIKRRALQMAVPFADYRALPTPRTGDQDAPHTVSASALE